MARFKASVEKLRQGWHVSFSVANLEQAQEFTTELEERTHPIEGEPARRFEVTMRRQEDNSYKVRVYQSKLSEAQELVKEMFNRFRDEIEAGTGEPDVNE